MSRGPIGRDQELADLVATLATAAAGDGQIVEVVGDAGIGKSTLLDALVARAVVDGARVWRHAPTRPEIGLPWSGLAALVANATESELARMSPPARRHLAAATSAGSTDTVEPQMVAFALTELLDGCGRRDRPPLVLVIDDVHWLDQTSAGALSYAIRGVPRRHGVVVLARRSGEAWALEPDRLVPADNYRLLELDGLNAIALRELIAATGITLRRAELELVHRRTGGNPLYAVEIARLVGSGHRVDDAMVPPSLRATLRSRVDALPQATVAVLRAAALLAVPRIDLLTAALPEIDVLAACAAAEVSGIVTIRSAATVRPRVDLVVFSHPLLAAAAVDAMSTLDRRRLHGLLANVVQDLGERATHVAASMPDPDEAVAALLESAGALAIDRGAPDMAVDLLRASVDATPDVCDSPDQPTPRQRRVLALAGAQIDAVQDDDALQTLAELDAAATGDLAACVTGMRVIPIARTQGTAAGRAAAREALAVIADPAARAVHHQHLVTLEEFDDVGRGLQAARSAFDEAAASGDVRAADIAGLALAGAQVLAGQPVDVSRAIDAADRWAGPWTWSSPPGQLVHVLTWTEHASAIAHAERVQAAGVARGDRIAQSNCLSQIGAVLFTRGDWEQAEGCLRRSIELDEPSGPLLADLAYLLASSGREGEARGLLDQVTARGRLDLVHLDARRGLIGLLSGATASVDGLVEAEALAIDVGLRAVRAVPYRRDLVEALVAVGRVDEASAAVERLMDDAARCDLDNARADAAAAGAVVEAALGHAAEARDMFVAAAKMQERSGLRYELARTLLAAGSAARRAGRRADGRESLDEAAVLFGDMGARPWVARCADEVARIGLRSTARGSASRQLTPTEQQVADLVADGRTNAEIANALFVSVRTVESNLTRVYRKLGLRSRTELTRHVGSASGG